MVRFFNRSYNIDDINNVNPLAEDNIDIYMREYDMKLFDVMERLIYNLVETNYLYETVTDYSDDILTEGVDIFNNDCKEVKNICIDKIETVFDNNIKKISSISNMCDRCKDSLALLNNNTKFNYFPITLYESIICDEPTIDYVYNDYSLTPFTENIIHDMKNIVDFKDLIKLYNSSNDDVSCMLTENKYALGDLKDVYIFDMKDVHRYTPVVNTADRFKQFLVYNKVNMINEVKDYFNILESLDCSINNKLVGIQEVSSLINKVLLTIDNNTNNFRILVEQCSDIIDNIDKNKI